MVQGYEHKRWRWLSAGLGLSVAACVLLTAAPPKAQPAPPPRDAIEELQARIARGELALDPRGDPRSHLPVLLKALNIPVDSQVLVFSKTSFQAPLISPKAPRALYFNDDTAVGFVQGGALEITTTGANGRLAYYTLEPTAASAPVAAPTFQREGIACTACHAAAGSGGGMIVANVIPVEDGTPLFITADRLFDITDATTPFEQRWGGWYVTGRHGAMRHRGNVQLAPDQAFDLDPVAGQNVTDLSSRLDLRPYPLPTSDIVALMTLEHQLGAMNRIWTLAAKRGPADVETLVEYLVGVDEAALPAPVTGASTFTRTFPQRGPRDPKGRSLRDFDLQTRLFRYPLSYTVYSRAFDRLDPQLRENVYRRLFEVLSGQDVSGKYASLDPGRRQAALEILAATKRGLPAYWRTGAVAAQDGAPPKSNAGA